jgi:hypothetical protein
MLRTGGDDDVVSISEAQNARRIVAFPAHVTSHDARRENGDESGDSDDRRR